MAAGDEMSIACGELSGMARYVCGVGMSMDVDGIESRVSLQTIELNGSTVLCVSTVVRCIGTCARRDPRRGLSREEIDIEEPKDWSKSLTTEPSRDVFGDDDRRVTAGTSAPTAQPGVSDVVAWAEDSSEAILLLDLVRVHPAD